ncbi:growth/differentiation factor 8 [Contarinia nasturtii]|uniref:growth/differentiation factor 8 n=1 Tax=Contarinia nasturtii TaxID=265458 RepID=UPI0012D396B8|nr:growth/differentiation factor 8 [Contarinia nasturtii]
MNRFLFSLYIICLVHYQVPKNCVYSMVVNDIESGGSYLAKVFDHNENHPNHQQQQQQELLQQQQHHHHLRHSHNQQNYHRHHTVHHHQADVNHHVDAGNHNDVEIGHTQPNMWHILGQTVKSIDEKSDKHFDEQQIFDKMHHQKVNCPKCRNRPELRMTEEELTKLRIEYVKNQILKKLQMTERPNVSAANLPRPIAEGSMIFPEDEEEQQNHAFEQFYGKTTQKIIFLELDNEKCKEVENFGSYMCFTFEIPADIDYNDVDAAELWVYRQPDPNAANEAQSFLVSEIESWDSKKINKPFAIHYANSSEGWGKIDFTWSIRNWIKYKNLFHVIDISCNTCEKHPTVDLFSLDYGYRPFIVVNTTSSQTIKRKRRSIDCSPGVSQCCRDKLYISFAEIGWNDWILHPLGYDAYFCRGSCSTSATISSPTSIYHTVVRQMLGSQSTHNKENSFELVPCCTATQFSSLELLYMENNSTATRKMLPNMVVEACGCM